MRFWWAGVAVLVLAAGAARAQMSVPAEAAEEAKATAFRDARYGVRFEVPAGWSVARRDREVSTFRIDARTAGKRAEMRAVAAMMFNPFPQSTLSGAWFYFSVQRKTNDGACARQAGVGAGSREPVGIGGMNFRHGHNEEAGTCVELRDDVYTAYRRGSCFRFDAVVRTFCAISSGAKEIDEQELADIQARMGGILDSVKFDWVGRDGRGRKGDVGSRRLLP